MISDLIDGLSLQLSSHFGDEYTVYTKNVEQGIKEPCFSIRLTSGHPLHFKNKRYTGAYHFVIRYFPKEDILESYKVDTILSDILEVITDMDGVSYRGTRMHGEYSDDVLSFFVSYKMFMDKEMVPGEPMGNLQYSDQVKE